MAKNSLSSGHILFKKGHNDKLGSIFSFKIKKNAPLFTETFMSQFKEFSFNKEEKRNLTREYRYELNFFKSIQEEDIQTPIKNLIQYLNKNKKMFVIEASSTGAFLCLAAILSGHLPKEKSKNLIFELRDIPLGIFPSHLIKSEDSLKDFTINLKFHPKNWMNNFPTLKASPLNDEISLKKGVQQNFKEKESYGEKESYKTA